MKWLRSFLRMVLAAILFLVAGLWLFQHKLMYFPRPYDKPQLWDLEHRDGQRLEVHTSQGRQVAFYLPPQEKSPAPAFVWWICGGNGSLSLDYSGYPLHWDPRFGYLFVDYPGYGLCEGDPNPDHISETMRALAPVLQNVLHWSEDDLRQRCGVLGHSLGCAAGLIAADQLHFRRVVLCAPFTTMTAMAKLTVGWPLCYLNRNCFDNVARLKSILAEGAEVRIFHGDQDEVIPVAMSRSLAAQFPKIRYREVAGSHHNEIVMDAQQEIGTALFDLSGLPASPK